MIAMGRFFAGLILLSGVVVAAWAQNPIDAQIEAVKRLQDERKAQELQQQAEYQRQAQLEYERRQQEAAAAQQREQALEEKRLALQREQVRAQKARDKKVAAERAKEKDRAPVSFFEIIKKRKTDIF